ncbi:MAG: LptF/LptG family permease [Rikenellaceae bacterium]|nr:LptF/LptG family permease [Rikenellaceae bacterium]
MKKVHLLMLKSYLGPMFMAFFIVSFILLMNFMWRWIDELVGKGLTLDVIFELMGYAVMTTIPMALPLSTLFSSLMAIGNMGENYELLALKAAGISLNRILRPLMIVTFLISVASFFAANNLVPYSYKKMTAIIYDIRQQKQALEFDDGIFFNGIEDMSIRVEHQDKKTKLLHDVLIYDTRNSSGQMTTIIADSGYINLSDDKRYLLVTLYNGENYEQNRSGSWYSESTLRHHFFKIQKAVIPLEGFNFERSDASAFSNSSTKRVDELRVEIDSLQHVVDSQVYALNSDIIDKNIFLYDMNDSTAKKRVEVDITDKISSVTNFETKYRLVEKAISMATQTSSSMSFDETTLKEKLQVLYRDQIEFFNKFSLPVSVFIFFLIGASLGAIIRKGGMGMPFVISFAFFIIYYILTISGEKMAREGSATPFVGTWLSSFVLLPIAVFLLYKASTDSGLLNVEWYLKHFLKLKRLTINTYNKAKQYYDNRKK